MAQKTIQGSADLAAQIKSRRNELGLTIEEASSRAGVGTKTWSRYEAGESIRRDKCKGICRALNWPALPGEEGKVKTRSIFEEYERHEAWSRFLEEHFGAEAAMAFAAGSDILLDHIQEDLTELASMPAGCHIGQLSISWLRDDLPEQFLMQYDYDFVYRLKCTVCQLRMRAKYRSTMVAHSVMEELVLYLCNEEAAALVELNDECDEVDKNWVFDLFGDMDVVSFLYSNRYLDSDHSYHFSHWNEWQFYTEPNQ